MEEARQEAQEQEKEKSQVKIELIAMLFVENPLSEEIREELKEAFGLGGVYFLGEEIKDDFKRVRNVYHFYTDYNRLKSEEEGIRKKYPNKDLKTYLALI